jgi:hypothetical protein
MVSSGDVSVTRNGEQLSGIQMNHAVDNLNSAYVFLNESAPSVLYMGPPEQSYEFKRRTR